MLQHYQPMFNKQGMTLSMQHNRYILCFLFNKRQAPLTAFVSPFTVCNRAYKFDAGKRGSRSTSVHLLRASQSNINIECTADTNCKSDYHILPNLTNAILTVIDVLYMPCAIYAMYYICHVLCLCSLSHLARSACLYILPALHSTGGMYSLHN